MQIIRKIYIIISIIFTTLFLLREVIFYIVPIDELKRISYNKKLDIIIVRSDLGGGSSSWNYTVFLINKNDTVNYKDIRNNSYILSFHHINSSKLKFQVEKDSITIIIPKDEYEIGDISKFSNFIFRNGNMIKIYNKIE